MARPHACLSLALACLLVATWGDVDAVSSSIEFQALAWNMVDNGFRSNFSHEIVDILANFYFPVSKAVENELCRNHSLRAKAALKENERWAVRMLDASSKIPSGLLMGNAIQLGSYDECLNVESEDIMGQHCMVNTVTYGDPTEPSNVTNVTTNVSVDEVLQDFAFALGSKWSVCIPSSCTPDDLEVHLKSVLGEMVGGTLAIVFHNECKSKAHPAVFGPADWFATAFFLAFLLLVALSTLYDVRRKNAESRSNLLLAFSLYTNGRRLLTVTSGGDELKALHAIRTFSMIWVAVGHTYDNTLDLPSVNSEVLNEVLNDWKHAFIMNYRLAVDVFLLLSGLLLCYGFLRKAKRGKRFNVPLYYLHRYISSTGSCALLGQRFKKSAATSRTEKMGSNPENIRLTPAYAVMILFTATLLAHTDDGPVWEQHPIIERDICKEYWWVNMLYLNNYVYQFSLCMSQSWYLSLDMQLYIVSPLLIYPLWRWRRFGKALLALAGIIGILIPFSITYIYNFYSSESEWDINKMDYLPTHSRFTPWVLGLALGYLLHTHRNRQIRLTRPIVATGWVLSALLIVLPVVVNHVRTLPGTTYTRGFEAINSGLNRPAFALGVAWFVFACNFGYGGIVTTFFSWKVFTILSRLTYSAYLVHYAVILWMAGSVKAPLYLNDTIVAIRAFNVTLISFAGALLHSLVFEVPAMNMEKIIFAKEDYKDEKEAKYVLGDENFKDATNGEELQEIYECNNPSNKP